MKTKLTMKTKLEQAFGQRVKVALGTTSWAATGMGILRHDKDSTGDSYLVTSADFNCGFDLEDVKDFNFNYIVLKP